MHPIVNLQSAHAGALESPAFARRGLVPKVAIGCNYEPRKRTQFNPATGVYLGFNPFHDFDAVAMQAAILPRSLGVIVKKRPRPLRRAALLILTGVLIGMATFTLILMHPTIF